MAIIPAAPTKESVRVDFPAKKSYKKYWMHCTKILVTVYNT